jgi:hypothetical protein
MNDFIEALQTAASLIGHFDTELRGIVVLSLGVSLSAAAIAFAIGAPLGMFQQCADQLPDVVHCASKPIDKKGSDVEALSVLFTYRGG